MGIKTKALTVIEGMTLDTKDNTLQACYRFSHLALGKCKNFHEDWLKELNETYSALKKAGVI